jgi:hypothetical protein
MTVAEPFITSPDGRLRRTHESCRDMIWAAITRGDHILAQVYIGLYLEHRDEHGLPMRAGPGLHDAGFFFCPYEFKPTEGDDDQDLRVRPDQG